MDRLKKNNQMTEKYAPLTIYDSKNPQFPYFVLEWDECFTENEIREHIDEVRAMYNQ